MATLPSLPPTADDDDALSLSDLPLIHQSPSQTPPHFSSHSSSDFDFLPNQNSQMCAADDVFFQGQILPFRHPKPALLRSESMDSPSAGLFPSRSSSLSSSSTSSTTGTLKKPPLNLFHSHPSPSPKLQSSAAAVSGRRNSSKKSSSPWNLFRLGLLTNPPKIAFNDFKSRSRNSNGSNSSSNGDQYRKKGGSNFLGGCNCAMDAVDTVSCNKVGFMKRSVSDGNKEMRMMVMEEQALLSATTKNRVSNHRTFEWLKQLSLSIDGGGGGGGGATEEL